MIKLTPFQWSAFNFFGFYCAFGVLLPFLPVWLNEYGYGTEIIGLIIALGYLCRFAGGMFFSKKIQHATQLLPMTRKLAWFSLAATVLTALAVSNVWLLLPAIALFHFISGGSMPINETIASTWQQQVKMDYGKARMFGSAAFVVGSLSCGYLCGLFGNQTVIWIMAAFILLLASGQMLAPTREFEETENRQHNDLGYWHIFKQPTTGKMLIAISLIQAGHAAYYAYSTIYWQSVGISTQTSSLLWSVSIVAEIGLFFVAGRLFRTQSLHFLVLLSAAGAMLRWAMVATTTDPFLLAFSQLLHALSFGLSHYAMIRYIATQDAALMPKLQGLYFGVANCGFMALFVLLSGVIYPHSPEGAFWLMFALIAPALFIAPRKITTHLH